MRDPVFLIAISGFLVCCCRLVPTDSLEGVFVSKNNGTTSVDIRFGCPTRYVDHFPLTSTDRAQINVIPLDQCNQGMRLSPTREARFPAGREMAALDNVEYVVRGNSEAFLLMRFIQPVRVSVRQGSDLQSLRVTVEWTDESASAATAMAIPDVADSNSTAIVEEPTIDRSPARMQQAEEVARRRMTLDAPQASPQRGQYVINLESSRTPLDPPAMSGLPELSDYQLYMTEVTIDGKTWHRLRLGFFQTEQEAEAVLRNQQAAYPQAWTAKISATEFAIADANRVQAWEDRGIEAGGPIVATAVPIKPGISGSPAAAVTAGFAGAGPGGIRYRRRDPLRVSRRQSRRRATRNVGGAHGGGQGRNAGKRPWPRHSTLY